MTGDTHEFKLIHTFSGVPMNESLSSVHGRELISNTFEEGLDAANQLTIYWLQRKTHEVELQMKVEAILSPRGAMSLSVSLVHTTREKILTTERQRCFRGSTRRSKQSSWSEQSGSAPRSPSWRPFLGSSKQQ